MCFALADLFTSIGVPCFDLRELLGLCFSTSKSLSCKQCESNLISTDEPFKKKKKEEKIA